MKDSFTAAQRRPRHAACRCKQCVLPSGKRGPMRNRERRRARRILKRELREESG